MINRLTAVVLTKNEEQKIKRCLQSLDWVDEILVIDDSSTDRTVELAKRMRAKVERHRLTTFSEQRNWALGRVKTEWVLFVDADEEVTPELAAEMKTAIKDARFVGYRFPRKNLIFGKWIEHTGWYPDYQLHLFRTKKGRYVRSVHEQVEIEGTVGDLHQSLLHYNYDSIDQYLSKLARYTELAAKSRLAAGEKFDWQQAISKPTGEFLRRYLAEEGFKDGIHGLALSLLQAFSELIVVLKFWDESGFPQGETQGVMIEIQRSLREIEHWLAVKSSSTVERWRLKLKERL
jgi:glycosyltransferase involved in cell wall biosynthesis